MKRQLAWPHNKIFDDPYAPLAAEARQIAGKLDQDLFAELLMQSVTDTHHRVVSGAGPTVEFTDGPARFLFAAAGANNVDRTLVAIAHPESPQNARDVTYQRGYPLPDLFAGRPVDRGHLIPYTGGGQYGPNLVVQDRALNRGWSRDGRGYRAIEQAATEAGPTSLMFARPHYIDDGDVPFYIDLGIVAGNDLTVRRFRNRFDAGEDRRDLDVVLPAATNTQIGALGEEITSILLVEQFDAQIVWMGDAGMPRDGNRQDLDLGAIVDNELVAYEVKTRYAAKKAGRITRTGNLLRPRLNRPAPGGLRQASQPYVAERIAQFIDTGEGYEGVRVQVVTVDLVAMRAQWFDVDDDGSRLRPVESPVDCTSAAHTALQQIVDHRGQL